MTAGPADRLYNLLPAIYRIRDAENGEALKTLLAIIGEEVGALEDDIDGLYNNLFIETCDEWVVPYIGDLIGAQTLHTIPSADFSLRSYVAHTLAYRRRKGTATVLEQLAFDVSGWQARAVEYFRLLAMTQHLNHIRTDRHGFVDLREGDALNVLGGPFESTAHTADIRHISAGRGRYNIPDVGLFLWRLKSYPLTGCDAWQTGENHFTASPIALDIPLFNNPITELEISHIADEVNLPVRLRKRALALDLAACRAAALSGKEYRPSYFGADPVFSVFLNGSETPVPTEQIRICDLSGWNEAGWMEPVFGEHDVNIIVDPGLGRIYTMAQAHAESARVNYSYGFPGDIGGGPYDRRSSIVTPGAVSSSEAVWEVPGTNVSDPLTLSEALALWKDWKTGWELDSDNAGRTCTGIITISGSRTYTENLAIDFSGAIGGALIIQAADEARPFLNGSITITGTGANSSLTLSGVLVHGSMTIESGALQYLALTHCTLTPGLALGLDGKPASTDRPSLSYMQGDNDQAHLLAIVIDHCITGAISLPADSATLMVSDSIIQSFSDRKSVPVFLCPYSGSLSEEELSALISSFEKTVNTKIIPGAAFSSASVMLVNTTHVAVIPAAGYVLSAEECENARATLNTLSGGALSAGFSLTYAFIGSSFDESPDLSGEMRITVRNKVSSAGKRITIHSTPYSVIWDLLQASVRKGEEGSGSLFKDVFIGGYNGSIIAIHLGPVDPSGVYEIAFGPTDTDATTVYELGLAADSPVAISNDLVRAGPKVVLERTTIFGEVQVTELAYASGVIFNDIVVVEKNQAGCVRYSSVPAGSTTPRHYRCQPDLAISREAALRKKQHMPELTGNEIVAIRSRLVPAYTSTRYGDPGYCQLDRSCAAEICKGGENGTEMGAFSCLGQPQREANLRAVLDEYLRFGLEAGFFYVT